MTRSPKSKKPLAPVTGRCQWLRRLTNGLGLLKINGRTYAITQTPKGEYALLATEPDKQGKHQPAPYVLPLGLSSCSCGDGRFRAQREGGCKHRAACRALGLKRGA